MEQGNQLLEAATDANDNIRAENKVNFDNWQNKKKQDKEIGQGEDWFHGVTDVLGTHGAVASYYRQGKRAKELGLSYTGLEQKDISDAGSALKKGVTEPITSLKGAAQRVGDKAVGIGKSIKGTFFGTAGGEGAGGSSSADAAGAPKQLSPEELDADYQKNQGEGTLESTPLSGGTDDAGKLSDGRTPLQAGRQAGAGPRRGGGQRQTLCQQCRAGPGVDYCRRAPGSVAQRLPEPALGFGFSHPAQADRRRCPGHHHPV